MLTVKFTFHSGYILILCEFYEIEGKGIYIPLWLYSYDDVVSNPSLPLPFTFHSGYILMNKQLNITNDCLNLHSTLVIFLCSCQSLIKIQILNLHSTLVIFLSKSEKSKKSAEGNLHSTLVIFLL